MGLEQFLANRDFEAIRSMGHRFKGSGGSFGFEQISRLGATLEELAKEADTEGIRRAEAELSDYLQRVEFNHG